MLREAHEMIDRAEGRAVISEQSEEMYKRLNDSGVEEFRKLREENRALRDQIASMTRGAPGQPASGTAHQQDSEGQQEGAGGKASSNVVALDPRGNGDARIALDLNERYPQGLPPVGRW
jgi:hypothetical protein